MFENRLNSRRNFLLATGATAISVSQFGDFSFGQEL